MKTRINKENNQIKFPIVGHIKIGEKKINESSGKEYPVSLDYFKATGDYAREFHNIYGDKPNRIQIAFLSDNELETCYERMEIYKKSKRYANGDGEIFSFYSEQEQKHIEMFIPEEKRESFLNKIELKCENKWSHVLTLRFMVFGVSGIMGVWQFDTRAEKSTIQNIIGAYDKVKELGGTVTRTMFDLKVEKVTSNKYGNKNKFPVVSLIPNMTAENLNKIKKLEGNKELPMFLDDNTINKIG